MADSATKVPVASAQSLAELAFDTVIICFQQPIRGIGLKSGLKISDRLVGKSVVVNRPSCDD